MFIWYNELKHFADWKRGVHQKDIYRAMLHEIRWTFTINERQRSFLLSSFTRCSNMRFIHTHHFRTPLQINYTLFQVRFDKKHKSARCTHIFKTSERIERAKTVTRKERIQFLFQMFILYSFWWNFSGDCFRCICFNYYLFVLYLHFKCSFKLFCGIQLCGDCSSDDSVPFWPAQSFGKMANRLFLLNPV